MHGDDPSETPRQPPLQFNLRTVFAITIAVGLLFGTLRWLGVPETAGFLVLVVLGASALVCFAWLACQGFANDVFEMSVDNSVFREGWAKPATYFFAITSRSGMQTRKVVLLR